MEVKTIIKMAIFGVKSLAANGRVMLSFHKSSVWLVFNLRYRMRFVHNFRRAGEKVYGGTDQFISKDFVRGDIRLLSGYDHLSGLYLLADTPAGDTFLTDAAKNGI